MLYSSPNFKISAFCKQWAICSQGLQAKKYSNLLQNRSPNSTDKPKPPTWYAAVMPTCRTEIGPEQGDLRKNDGRLHTCTHKGRCRLWVAAAGVRTLILQTQLGERKQDKWPLRPSTCFQAPSPQWGGSEVSMGCSCRNFYAEEGVWTCNAGSIQSML